jgi:predicted amidohydrolase YtcJ
VVRGQSPERVGPPSRRRRADRRDGGLHAITLGPAYTLKLDRLVGSIDVGKFADFAVLDEDPLAVPPEALKDIPVAATVLGGRVFPAEE